MLWCCIGAYKYGLDSRHKFCIGYLAYHGVTWNKASLKVVAFIAVAVITGCAKKWPNLFLSELCQISTKFDIFWRADSQDDRNM